MLHAYCTLLLDAHAPCNKTESLLVLTGQCFAAACHLCLPAGADAAAGLPGATRILPPRSYIFLQHMSFSTATALGDVRAASGTDRIASRLSMPLQMHPHPVTALLNCCSTGNVQIFRFTVWSGRPTPGSALMNLRYRDERQSRLSPSAAPRGEEGVLPKSATAAAQVLHSSHSPNCRPASYSLH